MAEALLDRIVETQDAAPNRQIHIRFDGRSIDVNQSDLDVGINSDDQRIREAVANHLGVPAHKLEAFAIDRNQANGHMTLRPEAVFGR